MDYSSGYDYRFMVIIIIIAILCMNAITITSTITITIMFIVITFYLQKIQLNMKIFESLKMDRNIIPKYGTKNGKKNGEENKKIFLKYNIENI